MYALQDQRPEVRSLAAAELAEKNDHRAIPDIRQAVANEVVKNVRVNMLLALAKLGDRESYEQLHTDCRDNNLQVESRFSIASRLLDLGDFACLPQLAEMFRSEDNSRIRQSAVQYLIQAGKISTASSPTIHDVLIEALLDKDAAVRQQASEGVAALEDKAALPNLEAAVAKETDSGTRTRMQRNLTDLQRAIR